MRLEQLKYLVDIAETGSITATVERFFMSQQAVSKNIRQLEREYGIELLRRSNNVVVFTEEGEAFVEFARRVLTDETNLKQQFLMKQEAENDCMNVKICSTSAVTNIVLPRIIAKFDAQQKLLSLNLSLTDNPDAIFSQVLNGECDLGLISFNEEELRRKYHDSLQALELQILAHDEILAVMDQRYYDGIHNYLPNETFRKRRVTLYSLIPIELFRSMNLVYSNDADFHRGMLEHAGAVVVMPGLAYQYFFNSRRYVALPMEDSIKAEIVHAAVYRSDADDKLKEFVSMIRREMYVK
jgi:DNA-binding transcriptional LysR family regulator